MYRIPILMLFGLLSLSEPQNAYAAPHVKPPLVEMRQAGNVAVEGKLVAIDNASNTISFKVERALHGEFRTGVTRVLVPQETLALFSAQTNYLLVLVVSALDPKAKAFAPVEVPSLFVVEGASPAIFLANEQTRQLFDPKHFELEAAPSYRSELLTGLQDADPQLVELYSAELLLRAEIRTALSASESASLLRMVDNDSLRPQTRARILIAASNQFFNVPKAEVDEAALNVLRKTPSNSATSGFDNSTELLLAALNNFNNQLEVPLTLSSGVLTKYLRSSHPAVVETAVLLLKRIAPDEVDSMIQLALGYALLNRDARSVLTEFQRRQQLQSQ